MQIYVENRRGVRYRVTRGWISTPEAFENITASQLLSSFDESALDRIYDQFFAIDKRSVDLGSPLDGIHFTTLDPLTGAPGHFSERHREIFIAVARHRLSIEAAPFHEGELDDRQSLLRSRIRMGLQKIIAEERAEAARIEAAQQKRNVLEKVGAYAERGASGIGNAAWGLAVWVKDIAEVAALINPVRQSTEVLLGAALHDRSPQQSTLVYLGKVKKEVVDVLGFDPSKITVEQLELAFEVAHLICDDAALRSDIARFAKDYVKAQHSLEITEFAGGGVFEIVLTIVLAAITGGAGAAAVLAKNGRLLTRFRGIGELMVDFAKYQKSRRALAKKRGARIDGTSFDKLKSEEVAAPKAAEPLASKPAAKSAGAGGKAGDGKSGDEKPGADTKAAKSSEPDRSGGETGTNQNGDASQCNATACEGGEPINLKTGEERLTLVDAVLDGPLPLTVARTYRSSNPKDFGLGHGWTHTLGERLEWQGVGKPLRFHDAEGRVISLPAPGGSGTSHNVVEQLSLTRVADDHWIIAPYGAPSGVQKHFKRADPADSDLSLAEIRDGYDNSYRFHYVQGQLICVESSLGEALHIAPADGRIGTLKKETRDGHISELASYEYDDAGDLVCATDAEGCSEHYRYHQHVIAQRTLKSGYSFHFEWDAEGPAARCVRQWGDPIDGQPTYSYQFEWDDDRNGVTVTDTRGGQERYRFNERALPIYHRDPEGGETLYTYNALGQVTEVQLPSENGMARREVYAYDRFGRLVKKTDVAGGEHRIEYNSAGLPEKITDPSGRSWQRRYNASGQVTATVDPLGNSTQYSYNPIGLVGAVTDPLGNSTRYLWSPEGRLSAVHDAMGRAQHYRYDNARRLIEVQHGPGQSTCYEYDAEDRISAVTAPDGGRTQYRYNPQGLVAEIVDAEGRSTRYEYDGLSQVKARTNPDGSRLQYHYDGERNLVGLTNEKGERYTLKYDRAERLIEEIGFDGRITRYAYNHAGHLISSRAVTDPDSGKGIDTAFERDGFGRLLEEVTPDGATQFRYNRSGQLVEAENAQRKLRWEYDACGRVTADWQGQAKIQHRYDAAGNRTASTLPDGEVLSFAYNPAGQFESLHRRPVDAPSDQLLAMIGRDDLGREIRRQHGNGLVGERDYDPQGRLHKMRLGKSAGPVADPVQKPLHERGYHYTRVGQLAQIDDSLRGTRKYHYDALDRLTKVDGPDPEHFVHDPAHNILAAAGSAEEAQQQADATKIAGNRLAFRGDTHYRYDIHGNRIATLRGKNQKLQTHYHYNSRQQLVRVEQLRVEEGGEAQLQRETAYHYDPLGRRIAKLDDDRRVDFLWDGDVLLREHTRDADTGQDLKARTYYFEPGTFKPLALSEGGEVYYYHLDHLGTPDALTNGAGDLVWSVSYRTYGNVALAHCEEIEQPIRFQGQYFDGETGLHYNFFRYYDPVIGGFISQDPVGLAGGINNYFYVENPVEWVDPYGLTAEKEAGSRQSDAVTSVAKQRQQTAFNFYKAQGFPEDDIPSHLTGIDFSKPVEVTKIEEGTIVYQYQSPGAPQGNYYSIDPNVQPSELGISPMGTNRAMKRVEPKIKSLYVVTEDTPALKSTAKAVDDFWSVKGEVYPAKGGATQMFTSNKSSFAKLGD
ncbi:polymorphic toxin type 46 domain-containing protein [Microbulbifer sp. SAOS-129_SWC]|uniref:polymorphic toxin type 46 domain-containing protein n=1 Tax=Microbulbifer sp. SAOS-129_SWC TaxID=3145235 RepID=UPI003217B5F5